MQLISLNGIKYINCLAYKRYLSNVNSLPQRKWSPAEGGARESKELAESLALCEILIVSVYYLKKKVGEARN